jgi:cysteine-rich repeat protein
VTAQGDANKAAARCRKVIATATTQLIATGLNTIGACHRQRNKGKSTADCNILSATPSTNFGRARKRTTTQIRAACKTDNPVLQNYPNNDVVESLFPEVQRRLERSGATLQGLPDLVGDKPKGKCHASIASARNAVMLEIVRKSVSCQKRLDKGATEFGALAAQCVTSPSKSASKASRLLGKCSGIAGAEVGSCDNVPGCVVEESTSFGRGLAALIYGGPTVCGNGVVEGFEVCDDGNTDGTDACTAVCQDAECGDGVVWDGVEECDDGNDEPDDTCDNCMTTTAPSTTSSTVVTTTSSSSTSTTTTTIPACGNGVPDPGEECDDGNENPTDGCTNTCTICGNSVVTDPETCDDGNLNDGDGCDSNCTDTACGNGLVVAPETCDDGNTNNNDSCPADCIIDDCTPLGGTDRTISVTFSGSDSVAGMTILLDYPEGKVSIPGSGGGVPSGIITDLPDGSFGNANDLDHALRELVAAGAAFPTGLLFRVHFEDCQAASAPSAGEFTCTVVSASDPDSQPVGGVTCAVTVP